MGERDAIAPAGSAADAAGAAAGRRRLGSRGRVVLSGLLAAALTAVALMALGHYTGGSAAPRQQPAAKNFTLPALGRPGEKVSLSAYAGKPVILNFFASWCTPCRHETPLIAQFYRSAHGRVAVIGIDVNDQSAAALAFVRKEAVSYPVGVDAGAAPTASAYGLLGLPQTFFLNAQHRIVKRVAGAVTLSELQAGMAMIAPNAK